MLQNYENILMQTYSVSLLANFNNNVKNLYVGHQTLLGSMSDNFRTGITTL